MKPLVCALSVMAIAGAEPARAQLGELQAGVVVASGRGAANGAGAGLVLGVAPGRLAYVGLRWTYHFGATEQPNPLTEVQTRTQVFAVDLGIEIPAGTLEVFPGVSLGAVQFTQHARGPDASGNSWEFVAAPGLAVEVRIARFALIPEIQYTLAGAPDLPWQVDHRGLVASVRLVILHELHRIRR